MKCSRNARSRIGLVLAVSLIAATAAISSADIIGYNPTLAGTGGDLFIPFKSSTSGTLGAGDVGLIADSITMYSDGATTSGYVNFILDFDLAGEFAPGEVLDQNTTSLKLTFDDIDFAADQNGYFTLWEDLKISFLANASAPPPALSDLILDESNYGNFGPGFVDTDNKELVYTINLKNDLGLTPAEFAAIEANEEFALYIEFGSTLRHDREQDYGDTTHNTDENIGNSFAFTKVPEPATLLLLASGGVILARRKRR